MTRVTQLIHDAGKYLLISVYPLPTHPTHNFSHNNGGNLETLPGWPKKLQHNRPARSAGQQDVSNYRQHSCLFNILLKLMTKQSFTFTGPLSGIPLVRTGFLSQGPLMWKTCPGIDNSWWRHQVETFSALLAICAGNSSVASEFPEQTSVMRSFSLICAWINGWVNNREAGDFRRCRAHYDVIVIW